MYFYSLWFQRCCIEIKRTITDKIGKDNTFLVVIKINLMNNKDSSILEYLSFYANMNFVLSSLEIKT